MALYGTTLLPAAWEWTTGDIRLIHTVKIASTLFYHEVPPSKSCERPGGKAKHHLEGTVYGLS